MRSQFHPHASLQRDSPLGRSVYFIRYIYSALTSADSCKIQKPTVNYYWLEAAAAGAEVRFAGRAPHQPPHIPLRQLLNGDKRSFTIGRPLGGPTTG